MNNLLKMKHINIILFALAAIVMASCGGSEASNQDLNTQLETYKKQQSELNEKIEAIQTQLASSDANGNYVNRVPVVTSILAPTTFHHYFDASGAIIAVQEAMISPEVNGQIKEVFVKEGDRVSKGQLLVKLNTEITEKSIQEIKTSLTLATDIFERQERLWKQKVGSEMQYLEASNNKANLENRLATLQAQLDLATIKAPFDGVIEKVNHKKGELAGPGMTMIHMVNLNKMYVKADVSERYISSVKKGDSVVLTLPTYPDFRKAFTINRIGNVVNKNNRTFEVELLIDNSENMLKPNMVAVININDFSAANSIVVPSKVIREDMKGKYLYVTDQLNGEPVARKRYITPGRTYLEETLIETGLTAEEIIIVEGYNRVSDGAVVKIMNK
jgi:RND family efflux transporter MFP subunit